MGRKSKLTPELMEKVFEVLRLGTPDGIVCGFVGISRESFYSWLKQGESGKKPYSDFLDGYNKAKESCIVGDLATISRAARGTTVTFPATVIRHPDGRIEERPGRTEQRPGDWRAAAWRLERKAAKDFAVQVQLRHAGEDGGPVKVQVDLKGVPMDELHRLAWGGDDPEVSTTTDPDPGTE